VCRATPTEVQGAIACVVVPLGSGGAGQRYSFTARDIPTRVARGRCGGERHQTWLRMGGRRSCWGRGRPHVLINSLAKGAWSSEIPQAAEPRQCGASLRRELIFVNAIGVLVLARFQTARDANRAPGGRKVDVGRSG
jgi:hypothetical protein